MKEAKRNFELFFFVLFFLTLFFFHILHKFLAYHDWLLFYKYFNTLYAQGNFVELYSSNNSCSVCWLSFVTTVPLIYIICEGVPLQLMLFFKSATF